VITQPAASKSSRRLLVFALLVLGLEAATFLARLDPDLTPFLVVLIPPVAALAVLAVRGGKGGIRSLFGRLGRWRVDARWYVAAIGIPLVEKLGVDLVGLAVGATTPSRLTDALTASALVVPLVVLVPALLEELGWRGFGVQTAVDGEHSPAWAAAVIGLMFVLAHVPFYLPGQLYDGLPLWPAPIWLLAGSVLLTWIYLSTGSVLLAGLMHAAFNGTVPLTWGLDPAWVWQARAGVLSVIAVVIVLMSGRQWWLSAILGPAVNEHDRRRLRPRITCMGSRPSTWSRLRPGSTP
jgi:membrane protease YdiL (CAAX protease family)